MDSAYWRCGIGELLIECALDVARSKGFKAVDVAVFADNKRMLRLVLKLDFIPIRMQHHMRADGADVVYLKRYLQFNVNQEREESDLVTLGK